ncbi:hypothetical protein SDC9_116057 [bioreactor metagenome]|uniref:Uncharacterized protein n=1 Tax=bioreactor metagenome TaxID=1076179 RepID=A0A645C195_9ZZZZ
MASVLIFFSRLRTSSTISWFATPFKKHMATFVFVSLPIVTSSKVRLLSFMILRSCEVLTRSASVKPSREPRETVSDAGSDIARFSNFCWLMLRAVVSPSTKMRVHPERIESMQMLKSVNSFTSHSEESLDFK